MKRLALILLLLVSLPALALYPLLQSTAGQKVYVYLVDSTDHISAGTGILAPTVTISKNGGNLGAPNDGTWYEVTPASGIYTVTIDATDSGTVGPMIVQVVAAGCDTFRALCYVRAKSEAQIYTDMFPAASYTAERGTDSALLASNYTPERGTDSALLASNYAAERGTDSALLAANYTAERGTNDAALASTALSNATWTNTLAGYLDTNIGSRLAANTSGSGFSAIPTIANVTTVGSATLAASQHVIVDSGTVTTVTGSVDSVTDGVTISGAITTLDGLHNATQLIQRSEPPIPSAIVTAMQDTGSYLKALYDVKPAYAPDVASTGEVGIDFNNVKAAANPTTLTNITIPVTTDVTTKSGYTLSAFDFTPTPSNAADTTAVKAVTDHLATALELNEAKYRFTAAALALAPGGGLTAIEEALAAIQGATFETGTDSLEAIRDRGDLSWVTGGTGSGDTEVDEDTGGADTLRYVHDGVGIGGASVRAYVKSDYDAGTYTIRGQTTTKSDGRWVSALYLNSGITYYVVFNKPDSYGPDKVEVTP